MPETTHPTDLDTLLKEERAKNERLEEGIAYLRGIEQRNNELIDALLARADAAEASALTARRDALEEAAKVIEQLPTGRGDIWLQNAFINAAQRIRTLASTVPGGEETG